MPKAEYRILPVKKAVYIQLIVALIIFHPFIRSYIEYL